MTNCRKKTNKKIELQMYCRIAKCVNRNQIYGHNQFKELLWQRILRRILIKTTSLFCSRPIGSQRKFPRYCLHMPLHRDIDTQSYKPVTNAAEFLSWNQNDDSKTGAWSSIDLFLIFLAVTCVEHERDCERDDGVHEETQLHLLVSEHITTISLM